MNFIEIVDSNVDIQNCTFRDNTAKNGGAIKISCNYRTPCTNKIIRSTFVNNTAHEDGGAVKYDSYPPILENNTFLNNTGVYGENIASYPVKIMQIQGDSLRELTKLENIGSGSGIDEAIELVIIDVAGDISKKFYLTL